MAVFIDGGEGIYEGHVLNWYERNGYEDSDWYAEVWDEENRKSNRLNS